MGFFEAILFGAGAKIGIFLGDVSLILIGFLAIWVFWKIAARRNRKSRSTK